MELYKEIIFFILGGLMTSGLITIWNFSFISIHLLGVFFPNEEFDDIDDLALRIAQKYPKISELLFCPLCLGFWISIAVSAALTFLNNFNPMYIICCALSWPVFIFYFYKKFES